MAYMLRRTPGVVQYIHTTHTVTAVSQTLIHSTTSPHHSRYSLPKTILLLDLLLKTGGKFWKLYVVPIIGNKHHVP